MKNVSFFLALSVTIIVTGCAKSEPPKGRVSQQVSVQGADGKDSNLKNYGPSDQESLNGEKTACSNPVSIDQSKYQVITSKDKFPLGKFDLLEMQIHAVYSDKSQVFTALSKEDEAFSFELQCKTDPALTEEAAEEAVIDTFKNSDAFGEIAKSDDRAEAFLALSFKDGDLSQLVPGMKPGQVMMSQELIGKDAKMSVMPYAVSDSQINVYVHIEFQNGEGKIRHIYGTATYLKSEEALN